jgi:OHCU decarboxylase
LSSASVSEAPAERDADRRTGEEAARGLGALNALGRSEAEATLLRCCGSLRWARLMAALRPYHTESALTDAAADVWQALAPRDWLQAFAAHPRIGASLSTKGSASRAWSADEQSGAMTAGAADRTELGRLNDEYDSRFGHTFIVCASGLGAGEMVSRLRARMTNAPADEIAIAAAEQAKITELRLHKLLAELAEG